MNQDRRGLVTVARAGALACIRAYGSAVRRLGWRSGGPKVNTAFPAAATAPADLTRLATNSTRANGSMPAPRHVSLGRYRLDRQLGSGSMGAVYLAHDPQTGEAVAVKTLALRPGTDGDDSAGKWADDDTRAGFAREVTAAARLHHPDIVRIVESGEANGLAFVVMEYVDGTDLAAHSAAGRLLPVASVLAIVERVARALAYAHRLGVVHRDIKPANLLLIDAARGAVKVTDFGIAAVADAHRTHTGRLLGSPSYMSPEQLAGSRLDGRTDLYSLGVVLFQLLTGVLPHRAESIGRLMHAIVNDAAADVSSLRPELPQALADVVARALERRPQIRYADGLQMADDLAAVARMLPAAEA